MPVVRLENVTKEYLSNGQTVKALQGVSLDVEAGEFVALVGRSGCGKSTLLNLCGAMDFPSAGTVWLDGTSTSSLDDRGLTEVRRQRVGFIFQSFQLLQTLTVVENVELPLLLAGRVAGAREAARERLRWVELDGYEDRFPHQLSGGQMQRVAIARALVHEPRVLLADEPIGNLDTHTGETVLRLLRRVATELRTTILMATHSRESTAYVDAVVSLRDGRISDVQRA